MTPRSELFEFKATALADDDDLARGRHRLHHLRRRPARPRGARGAAPRRRPVHRARGRHRGRVPAAAPRAGRARRRLDRGHRRGRRELPARARRARRDGRLARCSTACIQRRPKPDPATYLGSGKAQELRDIVIAEGADTVVCDGELSPGQRRALEDVVKVKVIDRTALILDIFAQHAKSREGKAQVELAQLQYLLPRLRGWGESMSRQAGGQAAGGQGMGSRGPGETKIELDRRRINTRDGQAAPRDQGDEDRPRHQAAPAARRTSVPSVAIAGYTNAGKSSLLNRLTGAGVLVENALFATLDPTVRRAETADGRLYTLADTVGFVRDLPHQLVEAFRSTLEEVGRRRPAPARRRRLAPRPRGPDLAPCARCSPTSARDRRPGDHRRQQGRRGRPRGPRPAASATRSTRRRVGPHRPGPRPSCRRSSPTSCRARTSPVDGAGALRPGRPGQPAAPGGRGALQRAHRARHPGRGQGRPAPGRRARGASPSETRSAEGHRRDGGAPSRTAPDARPVDAPLWAPVSVRGARDACGSGGAGPSPGGLTLGPWPRISTRSCTPPSRASAASSGPAR